MEISIAWFASHYFFTALAEWLACLVYILLAKRRVRGVRFGIACTLMLAVQVIALWLTSTADIPFSFTTWLFLRVPCYLACMWGFVFLCCAIPRIHVTYLCMRSFLLAEFAWSVYMRAFHDWIEPFWPMFLMKCITCIVVYGAVFGVMYMLERRFTMKIKEFQIMPHEMRMVIIICAVTFTVTSLFSSRSDVVFGSNIAISHALVDFLGILFLFQYRLWFANLQKQQELAMIRRVMDHQGAQYKQSQESIDLVNRKYHDMKQMLTLLRVEGKEQQRVQWLDAIEEDIQAYEAWNDTGHQVLNTVLTDKRLFCMRHGIALHCVADGALLQNMHALDICSIFGNALDNAIECVLTIPDTQKRVVRVSVFAKQGFLMMRFENVCEQELVFEQGLPVTTKEHRDCHGYGIKNIRYVLQKYDGTMTIDAQNQRFMLNILIPLPVRRAS